MDSRVRHITKAITWRVIASTTTFSLTLAFFGKTEIAMATWLTAIETLLKIAFYYFHERIWFKFSTKLNSKMRHIAKAITWRVIASGTTFVLAILLFSGHEGALEKATWIAIFESGLKMLFYYGHEEIWYRVNLGLDRKELEKK